MNKRPSAKQQANMVERWNAQHRTGTYVALRLDDGKIRHSKTESEAWLLGGHTAVIKLAGISGGYSLSRVTVLDEAVQWNPYNKVVQSHRDGAVDAELTNIERRERGLPVPWTVDVAKRELISVSSMLILSCFLALTGCVWPGIDNRKQGPFDHRYERQSTTETTQTNVPPRVGN